MTPDAIALSRAPVEHVRTPLRVLVLWMLRSVEWAPEDLAAEGWTLDSVDEDGVATYVRPLTRPALLLDGPRCPWCSRAMVRPLTDGRWHCDADDWRAVSPCGWTGEAAEVIAHMERLLREVAP